MSETKTQRFEKLREEAATNDDDEMVAIVDRALAGDGPLMRSFWLRAAANVIVEAPTDCRKNLYDIAVRRIATTFRADPHERQAAVRHLAAQVLPVA
mgnify:CR=1 FL=1